MGLRPGCELFMKPRRIVSRWEPRPRTRAFPLPGPGLDGALAWRGSGVGGDCAKWVSRVEGLRAVGGTRVQARGCQGTVISSREQSAAPGQRPPLCPWESADPALACRDCGRRDSTDWGQVGAILLGDPAPHSPLHPEVSGLHRLPTEVLTVRDPSPTQGVAGPGGGVCSTPEVQTACHHTAVTTVKSPTARPTHH